MNMYAKLYKRREELFNNQLFPQSNNNLPFYYERFEKIDIDIEEIKIILKTSHRGTGKKKKTKAKSLDFLNIDALLEVLKFGDIATFFNLFGISKYFYKQSKQFTYGVVEKHLIFTVSKELYKEDRYRSILKNTFPFVGAVYFQYDVTKKAILDVLVALTKVKKILLKDCAIVDDNFFADLFDEKKVTIQNRRSLIQLDLSNCYKITDKALKDIVNNFTNISRLNLENCVEISDIGIKHLIGLKSLSHINLKGCNKIGNSSMEHLRKRRLTDVVIDECFLINDEGFKHLDRVVNLSARLLTEITGKALFHLKNCRELDIRGCVKLLKLNIPDKVEILRIYSHRVDQTRFRGDNKLEHGNTNRFHRLSGVQSISTKNLEHLKVFDGLNKLIANEHLSLIGYDDMGINETREIIIKRLTNLEELDLINEFIHIYVSKNFKQYTKFKKLNITHIFSNIAKLDVSKLTHLALHQIRTGLPLPVLKKVTHLDLEYLKIFDWIIDLDKYIPFYMAFPKLKWVDLSNTHILFDDSFPMTVETVIINTDDGMFPANKRHIFLSNIFKRKRLKHIRIKGGFNFIDTDFYFLKNLESLSIGNMYGIDRIKIRGRITYIRNIRVIYGFLFLENIEYLNIRHLYGMDNQGPFGVIPLVKGYNISSFVLRSVSESDNPYIETFKIMNNMTMDAVLQLYANFTKNFIERKTRFTDKYNIIVQFPKFKKLKHLIMDNTNILINDTLINRIATKTLRTLSIGGNVLLPEEYLVTDGHEGIHDIRSTSNITNVSICDKKALSYLSHLHFYGYRDLEDMFEKTDLFHNTKLCSLRLSKIPTNTNALNIISGVKHLRLPFIYEIQSYLKNTRLISIYGTNNQIYENFGKVLKRFSSTVSIMSFLQKHKALQSNGLKLDFSDEIYDGYHYFSTGDKHYWSVVDKFDENWGDLLYNPFKAVFHKWIKSRII